MCRPRRTTPAGTVSTYAYDAAHNPVEMGAARREANGLNSIRKIIEREVQRPEGLTERGLDVLIKKRRERLTGQGTGPGRCSPCRSAITKGLVGVPARRPHPVLGAARGTALA
ncbi:RHS repeat domain-containing protein [Streptomyces albogriseolus]|uniref:RHS repeat domain-containing protein n=1 Tax=Streptomyces albogriseolus TaxID=1887 RepID=UPI0036E82909